VIDNILCTDSWPSIADAGCDLVCVVVGEEQEKDVLARVAFG
jgi:hypothetical protein